MEHEDPTFSIQWAIAIVLAVVLFFIVWAILSGKFSAMIPK
jgi:hypothetical protein